MKAVQYWGLYLKQVKTELHRVPLKLTVNPKEELNSLKEMKHADEKVSQILSSFL